MSNVLTRLRIPLIILAVINLIGFIYHKNYDGAVSGSIIGMIVGVLALEIRDKSKIK